MMADVDATMQSSSRLIVFLVIAKSIVVAVEGPVSAEGRLAVGRSAARPEGTVIAVGREGAAWSFGVAFTATWAAVVVVAAAWAAVVVGVAAVAARGPAFLVSVEGTASAAVVVGMAVVVERCGFVGIGIGRAPLEILAVFLETVFL